MKIMAIDYGDAHTGIAVSDALLTLAGFTTVITAYRPEAVAAEVQRLIAEHGVTELVLGHPLNMDGTRGPRAEKAEGFAALLRETGAKILVTKDTGVLTIKNLPASVLTGSDVNKSVLVTCNIQMDLQVLGEINTSARMCIWNQK